MGLMLHAEDLSFQYSTASRPVFSQVALEAEEGQICCILGPNGTGKSTLIKCLAGLLAPATGHITLQGRNLATLTEKKRAQVLAYVPQSHQGVFAFTVRDVVLMGRTPHLGLLAAPGKEDRRIASEALNQLGIEHLADKSYTAISGGERQLVLFARVLAQQPRLLLLDEPTSHLDLGNMVRMLALIRLLASHGITIIMTSHFPDHAFLLADQVIVMRAGQLLGAGKPGDILSDALLSQTYGTAVQLAQVPDYGMTCVPLHPLRSTAFEDIAYPADTRPHMRCQSSTKSARQ